MLREIDTAIRGKAPESLPALALLLDTARIEVVRLPSRSSMKKAKQFVAYEADAKIVAAAFQAKVDFFVAHDQKHFLKNLTHSKMKF